MNGKIGYLVCLVFLLGLARNATADLVAHWPFDEGAGTVATDRSENSYDGTLYGGAAWTDGIYKGALHFNGSDAYVGTGQSFLNDLTGFTLAGWVSASNIDVYSSLFGQNDLIEFGFIGGSQVGTWLLGNNWQLVAADYTFEYPSWHHLALVGDATGVVIYIDGQEAASDEGSVSSGSSGFTFNIGAGVFNATGDPFLGEIDDVWVFDSALTQDEIQTLMLGSGGYPFASRPNPEDGAMYLQTWANISWRAGDFAVSHDFYIGTDFDDVNEATHDSDTYRGNTAEEWFIVGFPAYPYPTGLPIGTTFYWRVDEVNDANEQSPWKGPVWSFWLPPRNAYRLRPVDGAMFTDPNVDLSWGPGWNAAMHFVYFGEDFDDVNSASGAPPQAVTTYDPGTLELEKTYYWRVDEFDGTTTVRGDVLSFTVRPAGLGTVVREIWENITGDDLDQLKDNWNYPSNPTQSDELTEFSTIPAMDNYGGRIHGWLYVPKTGEYTFWLCSDNQGELWLSTDEDPTNVQLIASESTWAAPNTWGTGEEQSDPIPLVGGNRYYIMALWKEGEGGDNCQVAWQGPGIPDREIIQGNYLSVYEPVAAYGPVPKDGGTDVKQTPTLHWRPGKYAASHNVYFGSAPDGLSQVATKTLGDESHGPLGPLELGKTYYWQVNEVNNTHPDSPWIGRVWSFTVADFVIVDNFEDYTDDIDNRIFQTWLDGHGYTEPEVVLGNGTGSTVGHLQAPFAEQIIIHSGSQSMPFDYNNTGTGGKFYYSETERTWDNPQDWTREGVKAVTLYFRGYPPTFLEDPPGTYTMSADGNDIWDYADQFRYAVKRLNGDGSIVAQVLSVQNTDGWAKGGVMIRESLEPRSAHAMVVVTPANGVSFQRRPVTGGASEDTTEGGITAPHWVKLTRTGDTFTAQHSDDGLTWVDVTSADAPSSVSITMPANVYIGLCLTSHNADAVCVGEFSDITTTGSVIGQWQVQDIGAEHPGNDVEQLYLAVEDSSNNVKVINHGDPMATTLDTWQEWNIDLRDITGVNLAAITKMYLGVGDREAPQRGGAGSLFFDDIRLYKPRCVASIIQPDADLSGNCVVDLADIEILSNEWLQSGADLTADLYEDETVDLKDLAEIGNAWLEELLWPQP